MAANPSVVFAAPRQVVVEDRPMPELRPGEALIRTHCTLISTGTELSALLGDQPRGGIWTEYGKYPSRPGYSNVGTVIEVGEGVSGDLLGRRVASRAPHAAVVKQSVDSFWPVADDVSDEAAVFSTLAIICLNGVRRSGLRFGESAVVYGMGLLGQLTARFCHFAGARPVLGVDISEHRLGFLPDQPGYVRVRGDNDPKAAVSEATAGRLADLVFELTGNGDVLPKEFDLLHPQGRFVVLSSPLRPTKSFDFHDLCNGPSHTIIGAHNGSHPLTASLGNPWTQLRDRELFADMLANRDVEVESLATRREPVENAPQAYADLIADRGSQMGVILQFPRD
ncbi:MAG: zinc-binding dehydrogenase [Candidatus Brocadiaceae bacterium]|nr:zinc-binding dehydrogenase [Candidatus Brocadiaceae bacterium]